MIFSMRFYYLVTFLLMLIVSSSAWATPIVFEFTGTINDKVVNNIFGEYGTRLTQHPEWNGQQVSGTISLELEDRWKYLDEENTYTGFRSHDTRAAMQVKFKILTELILILHLQLMEFPYLFTLFLTLPVHKSFT